MDKDAPSKSSSFKLASLLLPSPPLTFQGGPPLGPSLGGFAPPMSPFLLPFGQCPPHSPMGLPPPQPLLQAQLHYLHYLSLLSGASPLPAVPLPALPSPAQLSPQKKPPAAEPKREPASPSPVGKSETLAEAGSETDESADVVVGGHSPAAESTGAAAAGFQAGVTVGYTYDALFVSDGRSKKAGPAKEEPSRPSGRSGRAPGERYQCPQCSKSYATSSNLSRHKQTHRPLDSQHAKACPYGCGKVYVSMPALSMHVLTHKLEHKCHLCSKAFSRPWLLQGHLRSHSGLKPFGCAHCGKAFSDRSNLRAHMQTHSRLKRHVCLACGKSFALKSYLNKHQDSCRPSALPEGRPLPDDDGSPRPPLTPPSSPGDRLIPFLLGSPADSLKTSASPLHSPSAPSTSSQASL